MNPPLLVVVVVAKREKFNVLLPTDYVKPALSSLAVHMF